MKLKSVVDAVNIAFATLLALILPTNAAQAGSGDLDLSLGIDGKVLSDLVTGRIEAATGVALQDDGKIVVVVSGPNDFVVARYNPDGMLDRGSWARHSRKSGSTTSAT